VSCSPDYFWFVPLQVNFYEAAIKSDLPINLAGLLSIQFLLMHWVEVRRWMDIRSPGSANEDPIFKGQKLPDNPVGYPGGVFDPFGLSKVRHAPIAGGLKHAHGAIGGGGEAADVPLCRATTSPRLRRLS